mmetsp:Transcript_11643/g.47076  ORF Transcript_11643/g.47076 Transcript_11643/m.47076 type:complete len:205 (-) Transcript_11643:8-622(-)
MPDRAACEIAFCSAWTVACSCPRATMLSCGAPAKKPLYPIERTRRSFDTTTWSGTSSTVRAPGSIIEATHSSVHLFVTASPPRRDPVSRATRFPFRTPDDDATDVESLARRARRGEHGERGEVVVPREATVARLVAAQPLERPEEGRVGDERRGFSGRGRVLVGRPPGRRRRALLRGHHAHRRWLGASALELLAEGAAHPLAVR